MKTHNDSPRPWTLEIEYISRAKQGTTGFYVVRGGAGEYICSGTKANAALIVCACNAHDQLVELLRLALRALNAAPRFRVEDTDSYTIASRIEAGCKAQGVSAYPNARP